MRILVIGGTEFIGLRIVEKAVARGGEVMVVHRGLTEPEMPPCEHVHVDRLELGTVAGRVRAFGADAVLDACALTGADVDTALPHLPDVPIVVLSSMDVYRPYELWLADDDTPVAVPLDEDGPLREGRFPYRGKGWGMDDYDKLEVEAGYLARGAAVLRLAMIYGPRDPQRREEPVLRRVRARRTRIPVGPAATLMTRLHVDDAADAALAALDRPGAAAGQVFNVGEAATWSVRGWMRNILAAADHDAELVRVPDNELPEELRLTRAVPQHLLASSRKATELLGWHPADPVARLVDSVRWHLAHPPPDASTDFTADDAALGCAG